VDHDTAAFAVESIRRWWRQMGQKAYHSCPAPVQSTSSPGAGEFPRPARFRSRFAFATSPRCPRSRKYSSVRKADNFSATATLMNWLRATPSVSETRRASSSIDACRRKATLLLLISSNLPPSIAWPRHTNPKLAGGFGKMTKIESNHPIRRTVDRRLQHHLVGWILQPRTPQKPEMHRNRYLYQSVEHVIYLPRRQAAGVQVLRPCQNRLVLDDQRDRSCHFKCTFQGAHQQLPGGPTAASHRCDKHIGIENQSQVYPSSGHDITCNSTNAGGPVVPAETRLDTGGEHQRLCDDFAGILAAAPIGQLFARSPSTTATVSRKRASQLAPATEFMRRALNSGLSSASARSMPARYCS